MRWMEEAWRHVGVQETAGVGATPEIVDFFRASGRADVVSDEVPWCAAFVAACLSKGGVPLVPRPEDRLLARAYLRQGTPIDAPRVGALAIFKRPGGGPNAAHVTFVDGWTDTHIRGLGGNQSNSVNTRLFPRSELLGLRWPEPPVTAKDLAKDGSRIAAAAQRQVADTAKIGGTNLPPAPKIDPAGLGEKMASAKSFVETAEAFGSFVVSKWPFIAGGLAVYWLGRMAWDAWQIRQARLEDHNTGKTPSGASGAGDDANAEVYMEPDHAVAR